MKLQDYLQRIAFEGDAQPTFAVLTSLLRCHVLNVPFENLDVQLGVPLTTDIEAACDKIVVQKRGGWCYEQNGVFGWALSQIGFDVTRVAASVRRNEPGTSGPANHLCLLVRIPDDPDSTCLADVGFGGSMIAPIPFAAARHKQTPFQIGLRQLADGHWQFSEEAGTDRMSYDFLAEPGDESAMSRKCEELQTNPESSFVLNLVAQKRTADSHVALRGRVLTTISANGKEKKTLQSPDELLEFLGTVFQLNVPETGDLWDRIVARHEALGGITKCD